MKRPVYRTARLELRPYVAADFARWSELMTSAREKQNAYDWEPPAGRRFGRREFQAVVRRQEKLAASDRHYVWPVFLRRSGRLIGFVDVYIINRGPIQVANLGYRIDNHFWQRGYASEALRKFVPCVLQDLGLNRLEAVIDAGNRASLALARSAGLEREGVRRRYYYSNGEWLDQVVWVAIREDLGIPGLHPAKL